MGAVQDGKGKGFLLLNVKFLSLILLVPLSSCDPEASDTYLPSRAALELHGLPSATTVPCPIQRMTEGTGRALAYMHNGSQAGTVSFPSPKVFRNVGLGRELLLSQ